MTKGRIFGALLLFLLPIFLWVGLANGQAFRSGDAVTVPSNETVNSSLFASGRTIEIAGTVDGDVYCAGMNISVSGTVKGDVMCAGQNVTVSGTVEGDVRLAGQNVTISGQVERSASVATSAFSLESQAKVGVDLAAAGTDLVLNGEVGRDASLAAATATLGGPVGRNVTARVESLRLRGQADVGGGLYYTSASDAEIAEGAKVSGETKRTEPPQQKATFEAPYVTGLGFVTYLIISLLLMSLAVALLLPAALHDTTAIALASPFKTFLVGFVASLAVPVAIVVLMITILGIPLALLVAAIWVVLLFLAGPVSGYYTGRLLLPRQTHPVLIMAAGSFLILLLLFVPVLGFFVWLGVIWMGTGMLLLQLMRRTPKPTYSLADAQTPKSRRK